MSTEPPQPNTARARGDRPTGKGERPVVRRWVAIVIATVTLVAGGVLGYFAAGGPDAPTQLQLVTDLPAVTVTVPASGSTP